MHKVAPTKPRPGSWPPGPGPARLDGAQSDGWGDPVVRQEVPVTSLALSLTWGRAVLRGQTQAGSRGGRRPPGQPDLCGELMPPAGPMSGSWTRWGTRDSGPGTACQCAGSSAHSVSFRGPGLAAQEEDVGLLPQREGLTGVCVHPAQRCRRGREGPCLPGPLAPQNCQAGMLPDATDREMVTSGKDRVLRLSRVLGAQCVPCSDRNLA